MHEQKDEEELNQRLCDYDQFTFSLTDLPDSPRRARRVPAMGRIWSQTAKELQNKSNLFFIWKHTDRT
ncbi:unnamed protein product [Gadus morhua 'NCC']